MKTILLNTPDDATTEEKEKAIYHANSLIYDPEYIPEVLLKQMKADHLKITDKLGHSTHTAWDVLLDLMSVEAQSALECNRVRVMLIDDESE